jgi:hypothetical protein
MDGHDAARSCRDLWRPSRRARAFSPRLATLAAMWVTLRPHARRSSAMFLPTERSCIPASRSFRWKLRSSQNLAFRTFSRNEVAFRHRDRSVGSNDRPKSRKRDLPTVPTLDRAARGSKVPLGNFAPSALRGARGSAARPASALGRRYPVHRLKHLGDNKCQSAKVDASHGSTCRAPRFPVIQGVA